MPISKPSSPISCRNARAADRNFCHGTLLRRTQTPPRARNESQVGRQGLTDTVIAEISRALKRDGLVKIRFQGQDRDERNALVDRIAERTESTLCGQVGATASFYRPKEEV